MINVTNLLSDRRQEMALSLDEVAKRLKIAPEIIRALETGEQKALPKEPYCSLYLRRYAVFLGLSPEKVLAFFRRDVNPCVDTPKKLGQRAGLGITPQLGFVATVFIAILFLVLFLGFQRYRFAKPPKLEVYWPSLTLSGSRLSLSGKTDSNAVVRVNQQPVIVLRDGTFGTEVTLHEGENTIEVEAESINQKTTKTHKTYVFQDAPDT